MSRLAVRGRGKYDMTMRCDVVVQLTTDEGDAAE